MWLTIGKSRDNNISIYHPTVSRNHCKVQKKDANTLLIEDLDSTNGTFVNNKKIKQASLTQKDKLLLADFEVDVHWLFVWSDNPENHKNTDYVEWIFKQQKNGSDIQVKYEFGKLSVVYDEYIAAKKKIMRGKAVKSTGIRAALALIPFVGNSLGMLSTGLGGNIQEKLIELDEDFKKRYVCPSCFKFLGAEPFENLKKRGYCFYCKEKWTTS